MADEYEDALIEEAINAGADWQDSLTFANAPRPTPEEIRQRVMEKIAQILQGLNG
jgi:hypothetical protein